MKLRKRMSLFLILTMLFSFAAGSQAEQDAAGEEAESGIIFSDGSPWVDYSLRENIALLEEKPASPKDDFYLWVNYDWLKSARIEPGNSFADAFQDAEKEVRDQCLAVLNDSTLQGGDAAITRHLYNAFLDWDARNALGLAPLQKVLDRISALSTLGEMTRMLSDQYYLGSVFFRFDVMRNPNDPDTWITVLQPVSLLLMDAAEYRERTEMGAYYESVYREYIPKMLTRLGFSAEETSAMMTRYFAVESELAEGIMTSEESMSLDNMQSGSGVLSRTEAEALCGVFPLAEILEGNGFAGAQRFLVEEPAYLRKLDGIYRENRLEDLKIYLMIRNVYGCMEALDRESYDLSKEMLGSLYGMEGFRPDEEEACDAVRYNLPAQMAGAFFAKYDASKMKEDVTRLCGEIIGFYREMLRGEDWLTAETRAKAIEKLDAMNVIAVSPEKWPDYSGLSIEGLGYYDSIHVIYRYHTRISANLADQPADRALWYCTLDNDWTNDILQTNALYIPGINTVLILRGLLAGQLYRENMSDEELFGGIGLFIAHEITHAFDPFGAQRDAKGRLNSWWTEADDAAFDARVKKLIDYYNGMTLFNGIPIPGKSIQLEAVADLGAIKCVLSVLEQKKENVDYRAFFETVAKVWRSIFSWETEYYYLTQDPHTPNTIRVNTMVQQCPQFHETYGITEGDGMWLAPEDRIQVW